ncbi:hypothetical protein KM043_017417 [Ampulex compressa]|nr:hypothetical protein KM043_017417 [Ampulex compressa]
MKYVVYVTIISAMASCALSLASPRLLWIGNPPPETVTEEQLNRFLPVCIARSIGQPPCLQDLQKLGVYRKIGAPFGRNDDAEADQTVVIVAPAEEQRSEETNAASREEENLLVEEDRLVEEASKGEEQSGRSEDSNEGSNARFGLRSQQLYTNKNLNSPSSSSLVAYFCVPSIGMSWCEDRHPSQWTSEDRPLASTTEQPSQAWPLRPEEYPLIQFFDANPTQPLAHGFTPLFQAVHNVFGKPQPQTTTSEPSFAAPTASSVAQKPSLTILRPEFIDLTQENAGLRPQQTVPTTDPSQSGASEFPAATQAQAAKPDLTIAVLGLPQESLLAPTPKPWDPRPAAGQEVNKPTEHPIAHIISYITNKLHEKPASIVQTLQHLVERPSADRQKPEPSGAQPSVLQHIFQSQNHTSTTTMRSTSAKGEAENILTSVSSDGKKQESVPLIEVYERPSLSELLHKPENDISSRPAGLLDIFHRSKANDRPDSLAEPTEKPGFFGELLANPVAPLERGKRSVVKKAQRPFLKPLSPFSRTYKQQRKSLPKRRLG